MSCERVQIIEALEKRFSKIVKNMVLKTTLTSSREGLQRSASSSSEKRQIPPNPSKWCLGTASGGQTHSFCPCGIEGMFPMTTLYFLPCNNENKNKYQPYKRNTLFLNILPQTMFSSHTCSVQTS